MGKKKAETKTTDPEKPQESELEKLLKKPFDAKAIIAGDDMLYRTKTGNEITKLSADIVRRLCPDADDVDVLIFMRFCRQYGLDPYLHEVYPIKYDKSKPMQIVIAAQTFLQNADKQSEYDGYHCGWIVSKNGKGRILIAQGGSVGADEAIIGAWCHVFRKDRKTAPTEVLINEASKGQSTWNKQPQTMTAKCARGQAHRFAFPNMFGNTISSDEADYVQNQQNWEPVENAEVPKRDDRTGDPEKDVRVNDAEMDLMKQFNELTGRKLVGEAYDKFFSDFASYVLADGYNPDMEFTLEQIDMMQKFLKVHGLPKAIKDMIPKEKPQSEIETKIDDDPETLFKENKDE